MEQKKNSPLEGVESGRVLLSAVRVDGGVEFAVDDAVTPAVLASLLSTWLDRAEVKARFADAFIALAAQLVEEKVAAERIARWGRGFRTKEDEIS